MKEEFDFSKALYISVAFIAVILGYILGWIYDFKWLRFACYLVFFLLCFATVFGAIGFNKREKESEGFYLYNVLPPYAHGKEDYFPSFERLGYFENFWREDTRFHFSDPLKMRLDKDEGDEEIKTHIFKEISSFLKINYEIQAPSTSSKGYRLALEIAQAIMLDYLGHFNVHLKEIEAKDLLDVALIVFGFSDIFEGLKDYMTPETRKEILAERSAYISREYYFMVANLDYSLNLFAEMQRKKNGRFHRGQSVHLDGEVYTFEYFVSLFNEVQKALHYPYGKNLKNLNGRLAHVSGVMLRQQEYKDKNAKA